MFRKSIIFLLLIVSPLVVLAEETDRNSFAPSPAFRGSSSSSDLPRYSADSSVPRSPERDKQQEENREEDRRQPLGEQEKAPSRAESYFARPEASVGEAIGGWQRLGGRSEGGPLDRLLFAEELTTFEKIYLFRQLTPVEQKSYLRQLPADERDPFLKALGREGRWSVKDLVHDRQSGELEQFGYRFFAGESQGFAPERLATVGPDYVIGPGDTLNISIWGNVEANVEATVDRTGNLTLPKVGSVHLWGQTFTEARETIRKQVARYYTNFEINVTLGSLRSIHVYLVGEVGQPGTYTLSSVSTVLNALSAAGGPAKTGSLRTVQLVRRGEVVSTIDFYDFFLSGDRSRDARLQSGDTIHVPVAGALVAVSGDVRRPAIYEMREEETLKDLLHMAGGISSTAYLKRAELERADSLRGRTVLDVDLSAPAAEWEDLALQDRDHLRIAPVSSVSGSYVELKGYVTRPGRYQLTEGMRVADLLIPYENILPATHDGLAEILRISPPAYRAEKLTFSLDKALRGDPAHNLMLQAHDEVRLFSREEMEELPQTRISGAVLQPGTYQLYERMTVRDLVASAGNLRRSAYIGEAELTRFIPEGRSTRTVRRVIDLEKALAGDPQENMALLPEDHLFIRSIPDYSERAIVTLKGEVVFPGEYVVEKGEKLTSLLQRAGGYTQDAYLRGAVFTRESAKEVQRERVEKLIFEEEQEMARISNQMAQGALSQADVAAAQAMLESRKTMVAKLKEAPVTGRLVVRLDAVDQLRETAYDVDLMDGDEIIIPKSNQMVTVLGEVYNATALTYSPGKSVAYYLNQVGGMTKNANKKEVFVVRADGTVISKQQGGLGMRWDSENNRWAFGGFNSLVLHPGDAILVPERVRRADWMKEAKDITTIIYQMALGAAAVASF